MDAATHGPTAAPDRALGLRVANRPDDAQHILETILVAVRRHGYAREDEFAIRLSLDEALANAVNHGNRRDPSKSIHIDYDVDPVKAWVRIRDEGPGFEADALPDPRLPENLLRPNGRGVMLMRHYMTRVQFHPPGNCVELTRVRSGL